MPYGRARRERGQRGPLFGRRQLRIDGQHHGRRLRIVVLREARQCDVAQSPDRRAASAASAASCGSLAASSDFERRRVAAAASALVEATSLRNASIAAASPNVTPSAVACVAHLLRCRSAISLSIDGGPLGRRLDVPLACERLANAVAGSPIARRRRCDLLESVDQRGKRRGRSDAARSAAA